MEGFSGNTSRLGDWLIYQGCQKVVEVFKDMFSRFYASISLLLIKTELTLLNGELSDVRESTFSPLNLSLSQQENIQTLGAARFKPSARFVHVQTKRYMPYHRKVIYNPSNIQLQKTRSQAKLN